MIIFLSAVLLFLAIILAFALYARNKELIQENRHFRSIFDTSNTPRFIVNKESKILLANHQMQDIFGKNEKEVQNRIWYELFSDENLAIKDYAKNGECELTHIDGDTKKLYNVLSTEMKNYTLFELLDISLIEEQKVQIETLEKSLKHLKRSLQEQENNFKKTFDMAINGIAILNGKGEAIYTNQSLRTLLDYNENYLKHLGLQPLFADSESLPTLLKMLKDEKSVQQLPHQFQNRSGVTLDVTISMSYLEEMDQYLVIIQDVTKELEYTRKLEKQKESYARRADMDVLTPCFSRSYLDILLNNLCEAKKEFIYIMFDIDHFKSVNDTYGHLTGDEVLIKVVNIIKRSLRAGDTLARYGGEEFAIVLENTTKEEAINVAEKLRSLIAQSDFSPLKGLTCSFGLSPSTLLFNCKELVERADTALYNAKKNGRNRVEVYNA